MAPSKVWGKVGFVASNVTEETGDFVSGAIGLGGWRIFIWGRYNGTVHKLVAGTFCEPWLAPLVNVDDGLAVSRPAGFCLQVCDYFVHRAHNVDHGPICSV